MSWLQALAARLIEIGLSAPSAALWAVLGSVGTLILLGICAAACLERGAVHVERRPRGATRNLGSKVE